MRLFFTVRTLDDAGLAQAASDLHALAVDDCAPQLLIGIRSGGYVVAELMKHPNLLPITCRRPSTASKQQSSALKDALRKAPQFINNLLRIAEHIALTQIKSPKARSVAFDDAEIAAIKNANATRILIVDDSVDSGATLAAVRDVVALACPQATIKTAAITVTTAHPLIQPDYRLYHYVLCRFPWSLDFKR